MGLSIKDEATVTKVRRLAKLKRKGLAEVVDEVVSRELQRLQPRKGSQRLSDMPATLRRSQRDYAAEPLARSEQRAETGSRDGAARTDRERRIKAIEASVRRIKSLADLSTASEDEILGYNDKGLFD